MKTIRFKNLVRHIATILTLFFLSACDSHTTTTEESLTETFHETYKINQSGALSIRNGNGSITIHSADAPEVELRAIKKAKSAEQLKGINIKVSAQPESISINTNFLPTKSQARFGAGQVEYSLIVPQTVELRQVELENGTVLIDGMRCEKMQANVVDGELALRNCFANIHTVIANGSLELFYDQEAPRQISIDARIMGGKARVLVPRNGAYHLVAETANGNVTNELREAVEVNGRTVRQINMALGKKPRSEINLVVNSGDITIGEAKSNVQAAGDRSASAASGQ